VDIAGDVPGIEPNEAPTKMGLGPSVTTYDSSMIPNQALIELVIKTAEKNKIPFQLSQIGPWWNGRRGHTHFQCRLPERCLGVPTRHIHSHVGLCSVADIENTTRLVIEVIKKLDKKTVEGFDRDLGKRKTAMAQDLDPALMRDLNEAKAALQGTAL